MENERCKWIQEDKISNREEKVQNAGRHDMRIAFSSHLGLHHRLGIGTMLGYIFTPL
jgi:hypothetical protein